MRFGISGFTPSFANQRRKASSRSPQMREWALTFASTAAACAFSVSCWAGVGSPSVGVGRKAALS